MRVDQIISFLAHHTTLSFYANQFPASSPDACGVVRIEGGQASDKYVIGLASPSLQLLIRHPSGKEAEHISWGISTFFHGKEHFIIGTTMVYFASCDQSAPIFVGKDTNGRTIYSINVSCKIRN